MCAGVKGDFYNNPKCICVGIFKTKDGIPNIVGTKDTGELFSRLRQLSGYDCFRLGRLYNRGY